MAGFTIYEDNHSPITAAKGSTNMSPKSTVTSVATTFPRFSELPRDIRKRVYKHALPSYSEVDPSHTENAAVTTEQFKAYLEQFGGLFRASRLTRGEFRDVLFSHVNIGVNYSFDAPQDLVAITLLGFGAFQTVHIDVHLTDDFPLLALMAILSHTDGLKHLYLTTFTGLSKKVLPTIDEDTNEVLRFLVSRGDLLEANLLNIEDVHVDFVSEQSIARFQPHIAAFIQQAWMFPPYDSDSQFTWIIKRFLSVVRPTIELSSASDSKIYSNRGLEDDLD